MLKRRVDFRITEPSPHTANQSVRPDPIPLGQTFVQYVKVQIRAKIYYSFALVRIRTTSSIQSMPSWQIPAAPLNHVKLGGWLLVLKMDEQESRKVCSLRHTFTMLSQRISRFIIRTPSENQPFLLTKIKYQFIFGVKFSGLLLCSIIYNSKPCQVKYYTGVNIL